MIIHHREIGYSNNYQEFFEALVKAKAYMENKYPEISIDLMYNLAGNRGRATIQTRYPSLADYERIDAEADQDEAFQKILGSVMTEASRPYIDQFYRTISG